MNKTKPLPPSETNWEQLKTISDDEIDLSDIPEITPEMFANAKPTKEFFAERGWTYDPSGSWSLVEYNEDGSSTTQYIPAKIDMIRLEHENK